MLKLTRNEAGERYAPEELRGIGLDEVKRMIEEQMPGAFDKKGAKKPAKKTTTAVPKKTTVKKTAVVKRVVKKRTAKKAVTKRSTKRKKK